MNTEEDSIVIDQSDEAAKERYALAVSRMLEFPGDIKGPAAEYFSVLSRLTGLVDTERKERKRNKAVNDGLFYDVTEAGYAASFLNPDTAALKLGSCGKLLCVWYSEFRGIIPFIYEGRIRDAAALLETTIQLGSLFEEKSQSGSADYMDDGDFNAELLDTVYSYIYDYTDEFVSDYVRHDTDPSCSFALDIVMNADLSDTGENSYLYSYGEWITEEELGTAEMMASLPEETVEKMAAAYTEGYIRGFEMTGKDISRKSIVGCYLPLGFERFMRAAVKQFRKAGLEPVINRNPVHLINKKNTANIRPGFYGAFNKEYAFDHKEDMALFWGDKLKSRKLQALKAAYEENAADLAAYSGHACVEIFGQAGKEFAAKSGSPSYTAHQLEAARDYSFKAHEAASRYMPDEETSFTIIAWPTPSVAKDMNGYREIFERIIEINTLPSDKWQKIQQCIVDALDTADYVEVRGIPGNDTDIRVKLHSLSDPSDETNFENCVADVNIPAGEVFTSPELKGTDGVIHAAYVYIGGYLFKDLRIKFTDGRVSGCSCSNFSDPEEGRSLIKKIIFKNRGRLPMGEFAIGTNTVAYAAAEKYGIADKLPVLIAEKTGPHFAVGDTCYSYEEDIVTRNPDGKRITARENECSALRKTEPDKAYFNVHTDITLPYDGLLYIKAVGRNGTVTIIENGRFVLPGTEELNTALEGIK